MADGARGVGDGAACAPPRARGRGWLFAASVPGFALSDQVLVGDPWAEFQCLGTVDQVPGFTSFVILGNRSW